jgi:hypothetical protein
MPARAPCWAVADEVEAQAKAVRGAKLMAEPDATTSTAQSVDKAAWKLAIAKANWKRRTLAMVSEWRQATAKRVAKATSRVLARTAVGSAKKAPIKMAKAEVASKSRKPVSSHANVPARRTRYASAR